MSSLWLRLYTDMLNDPKVQRLPAEVFKTWVNTLMLTKEISAEGFLPPLDDYSFALRITNETALEHLKILTEKGLLEDRDGILFIHGWDNRQFANDSDPTNAERQRKFREKSNALRNGKSNALRNGLVTPPETETETETEEESGGLPPSADASATPSSQPSKPQDKPQKHKHGTYTNVLLTDDELAKLRADHSNADEAIERLSLQIEMKGYKAKSHYLAIKKWVFDALREEALKREKVAQLSGERAGREILNYVDTKQKIAALWSSNVVDPSEIAAIMRGVSGRPRERIG